jgi:hypothetical protein
VLRAKLLSWQEGVGSKTFEFDVDVEPRSYVISKVSQLSPIIASEDLTVCEGEVAVVGTRVIEIPENTVVRPVAATSHANGFVADVIECGAPGMVEDEKCINHAVFIPTRSGDVKEGDLLGMLRINFVRTGLLSRVIPSKPRVEERTVKASLTWVEGGVFYRENVTGTFSGYFESERCSLLPIVADERVRIEEGGVSAVEIERVDVKGGSIITPYGLAANAFAQLLDLVGSRTRKFEEDRVFDEAVLVGFSDGVVEKGEVLGLVCVMGESSGGGNSRQLQFSRKAGKGVVKTIHEYRCKPLRVGRKGEWRPAISDENRKLRRGVAEIIKIRPINVPDYAVVNPLGIMRQAYGTMVGGIAKEPWSLESRKTIEEVVFLPIMDGEVRKGQLIGVFSVTRVAEGKL